MNFLTFSKFFILFILHIANKPSNKKKVQSHLHTAIYNDCLLYEKTAMRERLRKEVLSLRFL